MTKALLGDGALETTTEISSPRNLIAYIDYTKKKLQLCLVLSNKHAHNRDRKRTLQVQRCRLQRIPVQFLRPSIKSGLKAVACTPMPKKYGRL